MASAPTFRFRFNFAALRNGVIFALALAAGCAAINARLPSLFVFGLSEKIDYLHEHRGGIDTIFIGSSRVYHAFDPAQFDRELAARGVTARSFNLGVDGMRPPESLYVLREVLKLGLPLRRVFIELAEVQSKVNAANVGSARYVHWHDLRHTAMVLRRIADSTAPGSERAAQAFVHARCFFKRLSNIGRGPEWIEPRLRGPQKTRRLVVPWEGHEGFEPKTNPIFAGVKRANYEDSAAYVADHPLATTPISPLLGAELRAIVAEVHGAGAQTVFVISPTLIVGENLADLAAAGIDAPVIAFTDPRRCPGVFRGENHCDEQHLNATGAAEFTRMLAEEFAGLAR
jgi:hypothetical protein